MGLESISSQNGGWLRWGWICDHCGEEITDLEDGIVDYLSWDPLPENPELRDRELIKREGVQRMATFHRKCAPGKSAGRYWNHLGSIVWDLMDPEDRKNSKTKFAERARRWREAGF